MEPERDFASGVILLVVGLVASGACLWAFFNVIKLWAMQ